jgi:hypothetical protein
VTKFYPFVEPEVTREEMISILSKGLKRELTDQEMKTLFWLSDCDYETRGVLTDFFKELVERQGR